MINEYPLFSFHWGDPHAHLLGSFNQLFFLALLAVMLVKWKVLPKAGRFFSRRDACAVAWHDAGDELVGCDGVCGHVSGGGASSLAS